jgi:hypothetical protein
MEHNDTSIATSPLPIKPIYASDIEMWYKWTTLFLGGCKYGDLALQVAGVSNETVK